MRPQPTEEELSNPDFKAVWEIIKYWYVNKADRSLSTPTSEDVMEILNALKDLKPGI